MKLHHIVIAFFLVYSIISFVSLSKIFERLDIMDARLTFAIEYRDDVDETWNAATKIVDLVERGCLN